VDLGEAACPARSLRLFVVFLIVDIHKVLMRVVNCLIASVVLGDVYFV
jgi:hypothetical protein